MSTLIYVNQYNTGKQNLEKKTGDVDKKILDVSGLVITTVLNPEISKVENKIPGTRGLATTNARNTKIGEVENKMPGVNGLVKKTDYNAKISDIEKKFPIYTDDAKCDQASDQWQQLELVSELASDLDWGRKCLVDFNAAKTQVVSLDQSNNTGAIDVKMDESVLKGKSPFEMLGLAFSSKLDWCSYITSIAKTASKKIGALMCSMTFLSPELLCVSKNLPYCHAWNIVVMSGLVLLATTWNC